MEKMGAADTQHLEQLFDQKKPVKNPLVPVGNFLINSHLKFAIFVWFVFSIAVSH